MGFIQTFIQMYGDVVLGMKPTNKEDIDPFEAIIEDVKKAKGVRLDNELGVAELQELVVRFKAAVKAQTGQDFPENAYEQLWGAICAVFDSWMNERAFFTARWKVSLQNGEQLSTYRPWYSVTWVIHQLPEFASLVMLQLVKIYSTANT